jgi:superoxide reductase
MAAQAISELIKTADFKTEKHVPVIECADSVKADAMFDVKVTLGKEVAHPNTTAHHIRWIELHYLPDGGKAAFQVARVEFTAHGEGADGADSGPVYTNHEATASLKLAKGGTLMALSYCNIHGLWQSSKAIAVS